MNREIARAVKDVDDHWTMVQACARDGRWLYASLALVGLTNALDELKTVVDSKL